MPLNMSSAIAASRGDAAHRVHDGVAVSLDRDLQPDLGAGGDELVDPLLDLFLEAGHCTRPPKKTSVSASCPSRTRMYSAFWCRAPVSSSYS
jgi:hypothetical protein